MKIYIFIIITILSLPLIAQNTKNELKEKPYSIVGVINNNKQSQKIEKLFKLCGNASFMTLDLLSNYIIIDFKDKSRNKLYDNIFMTVNKMYSNPRESINSIENSLIQVNGYKKDVSCFNGRKISISYKLEFEFKDNRIKIAAPFITNIWDDNVKINSSSEYIKSVIWGTYAISDIELYINTILSLVILETNKINNW